MFNRERLGWLLGRPTLSDGVVGWVGTLILPDFSAKVSTALDLGKFLEKVDLNHVSALGCTSSENLIAALKPDIARKVASKIVDLSLVMRVASQRGEPDKAPRRTTDLLAECMSEECKVSVPKDFGALLLEGRTNELVNFKEVDVILRSLLYRLAQKLRRSGEFRRYILYELPAHRVLLAQSRFRLSVDAEGVKTVADELLTAQRVGRVELVTRHSQDPMDFISSFEARRQFAGRHLGSFRERLTLGEFRDLLDEQPNTDEVKSLVASFLKNDATRRALLALAAPEAEGCQVVYDPLGTSTGRVVMRSPGVQWLEKKYRKYILPPDGYKLQYLDYSCFEPAIWAAASGDKELITACTSDVYVHVGEWLGLTCVASRDLAKTFLLKLMYGQAQHKLVATLSAELSIQPEDACARIENLGRRLARAFEFRAELIARTRKTGYMETQVGNRCLVKAGEEYKALSHYLQGTGALIFKYALVDIFGGSSAARLIVPMHDAFLCAFPDENLEHDLTRAKGSMQSAFLAVTGADLARVTSRGEF